MYKNMLSSSPSHPPPTLQKPSILPHKRRYKTGFVHSNPSVPVANQYDSSYSLSLTVGQKTRNRIYERYFSVRRLQVNYDEYLLSLPLSMHQDSAECRAATKHALKRVRTADSIKVGRTMCLGRWIASFLYYRFPRLRRLKFQTSMRMPERYSHFLRRCKNLNAVNTRWSGGDETALRRRCLQIPRQLKSLSLDLVCTQPFTIPRVIPISLDHLSVCFYPKAGNEGQSFAAAEACSSILKAFTQQLKRLNVEIDIYSVCTYGLDGLFQILLLPFITNPFLTDLRLALLFYHTLHPVDDEIASVLQQVPSLERLGLEIIFSIHELPRRLMTIARTFGVIADSLPTLKVLEIVLSASIHFQSLVAPDSTPDQRAYVLSSVETLSIKYDTAINSYASAWWEETAVHLCCPKLRLLQIDLLWCTERNFGFIKNLIGTAPSLQRFVLNTRLIYLEDASLREFVQLIEEVEGAGAPKIHINIRCKWAVSGHRLCELNKLAQSKRYRTKLSIHLSFPRRGDPEIHHIYLPSDVPVAITTDS